MLQITSPAIEETLKRALALHRAGQVAEADKLYVQVLLANPRHAEAWRWRGLLAAHAGQLDTGIDMIRQAIELKRPNPFAEAWNDLAGIYLKQKKFAEAIAGYQQALKEWPTFVEGWCNLGVAFGQAGRPEEAKAAFEKTLELRPDFFDAYNGLGMALRDLGRLDEALAVLERGTAQKPDHPEMLNNLGNCYKAQSRYDQAIAAYEQAIAARPKFVEVYNNLGNAYKDQGRMEEAIRIYRQAIALAPTWAEIHNNLANALKDSGRLEEALAAYQEAVRLRPGLIPARSNLIYVRHFLQSIDSAEDLRLAREGDAVHAGPLRKEIRPFANERNAGRRLRVGYVSPDFRQHSVAYFMRGLLAHHDPKQVESFCYADVLRADAVTQSLRERAHQWRSIIGMSDAAVADLIRADQIDILVDLSGHTAANRLSVFARRPAPVQVSYLGFAGTTGLGTIDYRITDCLADPPEEAGERFYTEKLVRLPGPFICFEPDATAPPISPPPVETNGYVTFGSFNALPKLTDEMLAAWARILQACPGSRLCLKTRGLSDSGVQARIAGDFAKWGIAPERIDMVEKFVSQEEHLAFYARVDIALDTYPYHGTTTTCEALWMGVPVVTRIGDVHRSRVGLSILSSVGLAELAGKSCEAYERIAVTLAADRGRLAELRGSLRKRMADSPLMDAPAFARRMEQAYREMWRRWCDGEASHA